MYQQQLLHTRRTLATAALMLATFSASALHAQVTNLDGDHRVIPQLTEPGNLDADGDLGWGRTPGSPGEVAGKLRYFTSPAQLAFDATEADAIFTWNDSASDTERDFKMKLDASNVLSLYPTWGGAATMSLTPDTGAIKLSGTGAGLFNGSGGGVLQIDSSGRPYFASKPIFQDGVDFGSGGTLDSTKVQYLQGLFSQLGYEPNESTYTDVTRFNLSPNISIGKAVYSNGYVYWVGYFTGPASINGNPYNESAGRTLIVKASPSGTISWVKQIASDTPQSYLMLHSIDVNASGTVAVGGQFTGKITNLGEPKPQTAMWDTDGFVMALNSSGTPQWWKAISGTASSAPSEQVYGVAIDASGNVAIAGQTQGTTIDLGTGALNCTPGSGEGFAVRYNSSGTVSWAMLAGGNGSNENLKHVDIAPSGDVLLAGSGGTTTNLGAHNITTVGGSDAWVASVSSSGTLQWTKGIGGTGNDEARGLTVDASGNVYVAASFNGSTTTLGTSNKTSAGNTDALVVKLNSSSAVQWATAIGGTASDYPGHLTLDSAGTILVSGQIGASTTNLGSYNITGKGGTDGFAVTLDSSGAVTAAQAIGGSGEDGIHSASALGSLSSGLFITGWAGANANVGDTRIPTGSYAFSVPQSSIVTRPAPAMVTGLDWNGGLATGTEGVAIGSKAFSQGLGAVAMGNSSAVGAWSFSAGSGRAYGDYSFAMGQGVTATGANSTAFGNYSWALGNSSFAAGEGANAIGLGSVALGVSPQALGDNSFAAGWVATASGMSSVALGEFAEARGYGSAVLGGYSVAEGEFAVALNADAKAIGNFSLATGLSTKAESYISTALGQGNIGGGHPTNWVDTDPLFEIGNMNSTTRSNAHTTLKNGLTTLTNRAWRAAYTLDSTKALDDPEDENDSGGKALVVEGHTELQGRVTLKPQGDLSMDGFTNGAP